MAGSKNPGYPNVIAARSADDDAPTDLLMDPTSFVLYTGSWVWNTTTLAWEKMIQPGETQGDLDSYWNDTRVEYSSGDILYRAAHVTHKAATSDTSWSIWKYTSSGDGLVRIERLDGAWDARGALSWA